MNIRRVMVLVRKEFTLMMRDRAALIAQFLFPILIIFLYGFAVEVKPRDLHTGVLLNDNSVYTQKFMLALQNTRYFKITKFLKDNEEGLDLLRDGKINLFIYIPENFTRDLLSNQKPKMLVTADMSVDTAQMGLAEDALQILQYQVFANENISKGTNAPLFQIVVQNKFNPALLTRYILVPSVIIFNLMYTLLLLMLVVMFRDKDAGTYEFLMVTPVTELEMAASLITAYLISGFLQYLACIGAAHFFLGIPTKGNIILLTFGILPYFMTELLIGMLIAVNVKTFLEGQQMAQLLMLLAIVFSGIFFSILGLPAWCQYVSKCLPITHGINIVKALMVRGASFSYYLSEITPVLIVGVFCILALKFKFRTRKLANG